MRYGKAGIGTTLATVDYEYDELDRLTSETYDDSKSGKTKTYGYQYSSDGILAGVTENGEQVYVYDYDTLGRLIHSSEQEDGKAVLYTDHIYDTSNRIISQRWQIEDDAYSEQYSYKAADGTLSSMTAAGGESISFAYDSLKRLDSSTLMYGSSMILTTDLSYQARSAGGESEGNTTSLVSKIQYKNPRSGEEILPALSYSYDAMGNITSVALDGETAVTYTYDAQNQLRTESEGLDTVTYTYDTYGNIRRIAEDQTGIGTLSSYDLKYENSQWRDLLTSVTYTNSSGTAVTGQLTYDAIGNPTVYFNGHDTWNFTWEYGRQLASAVKGSTVLTYTYGADGLRKSKIVGSRVYDYVTLSGRVVRETIDADSNAPVTVDYMYDNSGRPYKIRVTAGSTVYTGYYVLNQQGDVIAIIDAGGNTLVEYSYSAWGDPQQSSFNGTTGSALYTYNSLKYRGYYYDTETGFYYLGSRYYDPVIGRFINADGYVSTGQDFLGYNMYAYCNNNPVRLVDSIGSLPDDKLLENAAKYEAGANIIMCGWENNHNNSSKASYDTTSGYTVVIYDDGVEPSEVVKNNDNNVIVYDRRNNTRNPEMVIQNSYRIEIPAYQIEILKVLDDYDKAYPSETAWGRTLVSMYIEWDAHNALYNMKHNERCKHVNLDKEDEGVLYGGYIKRAFEAVLQ